MSALVFQASKDCRRLVPRIILLRRLTSCLLTESFQPGYAMRIINYQFLFFNDVCNFVKKDSIGWQHSYTMT